MRIWIVLTVLMFTVGRGNDIFNLFEDLFEKTDRQFTGTGVNFPALFATSFVTSLISTVVVPCEDTTPTLNKIGTFF